MTQRMKMGLPLCALMIVALSTAQGQSSRQPLASREKEIVRIGAVAYSPSVVTVFSELFVRLDNSRPVNQHC